MNRIRLSDPPLRSWGLARFAGAVHVLVWIVLSVVMLPALAQDEADQAGETGGVVETMTEIEVVQRVMASLDRALEYLALKQEPDGRWVDNSAVNGVAMLAFLGRGHVPGRGPYSDILERGKQCLLAAQRDDGYITSGMKSGRMYAHALATLALAELYGMDQDPQLEAGLRKAIDLIVSVQSPNGGWRYEPKPGDHDLSVTVMQIVALRAANNAEIPVPEDTIKKAVEYVHACNAADKGAFCYQPGKNCGPEMTAAGVLSLQLLGEYGDPMIPPALDFLAQAPVQWRAGSPVRFFFYFHYYAIQALYQGGGKHWSNWHPRVREMFVEHQKPDGSWEAPPGSDHEAKENTVGPNNIYATAMACLVLEIYLHFLPAYQR